MSEEGKLLTGPDRWYEAAKARAGADVVEFFGAVDPHNVRPQHRRRILSLAGGVQAAMQIVREEDHRQQQRIKAAGRAARRAFETAHPDLHKAFTAKLEHMAQQMHTLAQEARVIGHLGDAVTLFDLAAILETRAAEIEAEVSQ
jgi:hypothetical protein